MRIVDERDALPFVSEPELREAAMPALALRARRTGSVEDLGSADQRTAEVRGRVGSTIEVLRVLGRDGEVLEAIQPGAAVGQFVRQCIFLASKG